MNPVPASTQQNVFTYLRGALKRTPHTRLQLRSVAIEIEGETYEGPYIFEHGLVSVIWYNGNDFKRHQLCRVSSDPLADAPKVLRTMLLLRSIGENFDDES